MVIDKLALSEDDIKKIKADETSEMEEILTWLRHNTAMTLASMAFLTSDRGLKIQEMRKLWRS